MTVLDFSDKQLEQDCFAAERDGLESSTVIYSNMYCHKGDQAEYKVGKKS